MRITRLSVALAFTLPLLAADAERLLRVDHFVPVRSTVPAIAGHIAQIYVREVVRPDVALRGASSGVVLFVHGAGTPAEVAFDLQYGDYSWMGYLARAGFDVFSADMTGYGRSTRPGAMNDPCNLSAQQQAQFMPSLLKAPCAATYTQQMTTIASDWNDIGAVVDHLLALRHTGKVDLIAWSLGGPRAGGYTSQHPEKVRKLILLAPAYNRNGPAQPPASVPAKGTAFNTQTHREFTDNWTRQIGCSDQIEPAAAEAVWAGMLESDPVGATWGTGVRRAPAVTSWGWNNAVASRMKTPVLTISGVHDKQSLPERVKDLVTDLGSPEKVLVDLACSSHNAAWERNHLLMFKASLEWLTKGSVNGQTTGTIKLGY